MECLCGIILKHSRKSRFATKALICYHPLRFKALRTGKDRKTIPRTKKTPEIKEEVKTEKPAKAATAKLKAAAEKPATKGKARKPEIVIQSPPGGIMPCYVPRA